MNNTGKEVSTMKKRNQISLADKYYCIRALESNRKTHSQLSSEMGLPRSTIRKWMSKDTRNKIKQAFERCEASGKKKLRSSKFSLVDEALFEWAKQQRNANKKITNNTLTQAAVKFGTLLNETGFDPNSRWIERFKKRYDILVNSSSRKSQATREGEGESIDEIMFGCGNCDGSETIPKSEEEIVEDILMRFRTNLSTQMNDDDTDNGSRRVLLQAAVKQESNDFREEFDTLEFDQNENLSMHDNDEEDTNDHSYPVSASAHIVENNQPCRNELNRCLSTIRAFYLNQDDNVDALLRYVAELEIDVNRRFKNATANQKN